MNDLIVFQLRSKPTNLVNTNLHDICPSLDSEMWEQLYNEFCDGIRNQLCDQLTDQLYVEEL